MDKLDLRKLKYEELLFVKKQVVRLKEKHVLGKEIADLTGVDENQVSKIWRAYLKNGMAAIKPKIRGRKIGECRCLTKEQEKEIQKLIVDKTPDQLKLSFMLWTRQAIKELIWNMHKIKISLRDVTNYLKRWGFTCQRPSKRAYFQDNIVVKKFMDEEYPDIAKRAKAENAEIYWGDETGVNNQENYIRGFSPKGVTPTIPSYSKREKVNMLSAVNNMGKVRFMIYSENMAQQRLIEFMKRMIKDVDKKVFLILDNLKVHHGKIVQAWLNENKTRIEVFYLPPYAPERNPDEYLNHCLKQNVHTGILPHTVKEIIHKIESFMRRLQHDKLKVQALFRHQKLTCIAACN